MSTSPNTIVTGNAKRLFEERDLTQGQFADMLGVSQESVSRYLRGAVRWTVDAVFAWARALGVSVEQLINEHKPES